MLPRGIYGIIELVSKLTGTTAPFFHGFLFLGTTILDWTRSCADLMRLHAIQDGDAQKDDSENIPWCPYE